MGVQITYEAHLSWPEHSRLGDKLYRRLEGWDVVLPRLVRYGMGMLKNKVGKYVRSRVRSRRWVGTEPSPIQPGDKRGVEGKTPIKETSVCS